MRPILVEWLSRWIGHDAAALVAPTYFTMVALAALAAAVLLVRRARREGDDVPTVMNTLMLGYTAAVVGGIVLPMLVDTVSHLVAGQGLIVHWAGMVAYGGFAGAIAAVWLYLRRTRRPVSLARFGDLIAPAVGLMVAIVRCGCFVAGCDYGKVTDSAFAVRFPSGSPAWRDHVAAGLVPAWRDASLPVHPTQLYEAALGLLLFFAITRLARARVLREARPGLLLPLALGGYALGRSAVETLRGDASRGLFGPVSTSQLISLLVLVVVGALIWRRARGAQLGRIALSGIALLALLLIGAPEAHAKEWQGGAFFGTTNAMNRKQAQVPQLVGVSAVFTFDAHAPVTLGAQLETMSNSVATHNSLVLELSWREPMGGNWFLGGRAGVSYTAINFHDESFETLSGLGLRAAGTIDLKLGEAWMLSVWPLALETVALPDLGGPIISYEFRVGLSYTFGREPRPQPMPGPFIPSSPAPAPMTPAAPAPAPLPPPPAGGVPSGT